MPQNRDLVFIFAGLWRWERRTALSIRRNLIQPLRQSLGSNYNSTFFYFHHWIEAGLQGAAENSLLETFGQLGKVTAKFEEPLSQSALRSLSLLADAPHPDALRYSSQWESIGRCSQLVRDVDNCAVAVRVRLDSYFPRRLPMFRARRIISHISRGRAVFPLTEGHSSLPGTLLSDQFMVSRLDTLNWYAQFFGCLPEVISEARLEFDRTGRVHGIEELLSAAASKNSFNYEREPVPFILTKLLGDMLLKVLKTSEWLLGRGYGRTRCLAKKVVDQIRKIGGRPKT